VGHYADDMTYTGSGEPAVPAPQPPPAWAAGPPPAVAAGLPPAVAAGPPPAVAAGQPVPDPPPGPGVTPPFPVPPTEGRDARLWTGIGIGALVVVLFCGGGFAALVGLGVTGVQALNEQAEVVIGDYLEAEQQKRYDDAYAQLCDAAKRRETAAEFARRVGAERAIADFDVGSLPAAAVDLTVPVDVHYVDGTADTIRVSLEQDRATGELEVCRVER
ncbi:MAG TPA: hypothetical protein VFO77_00005, partial [Actinoplanes sp.]|nr:hypothetical protein [Actinoplanes sp.]